ncbi:hypothetical protein MES4922_110021 [Mesorhizobium ventifaucium]|uniref:Helix-turn-helix domain-containing protein n=1 Tax=Mesorhizobium ventifaucium TaxID=666020 RepID=A0ABN8JFE3_9HYPH|nr:hypothetical protein MES4922_110021 [Mesorhizobium ventifaucium]
MGSAVKMRTDYSAAELRRLAKISKDVNRSRRLLSLAAVLDGMRREDAARVGGMDRQTLRDWVHRFNEAGPDGLKDAWWSGPAPRLSPSQKAELAQIVETGPDPVADGVVRWRRIDLQKAIKALRRRLPRTLRLDAAEGARLLAHERPATSPGAGRRDRRGL